jgi:hypothetical protein
MRESFGEVLKPAQSQIRLLKHRLPSIVSDDFPILIRTGLVFEININRDVWALFESGHFEAIVWQNQPVPQPSHSSLCSLFEYNFSRA